MVKLFFRIKKFFDKRGFTLVELLAVIVILAIIMIIAIPSVINILNTARVSSFKNYAQKISAETQKKYAEEQMMDTNQNVKIYNIEKDLGLTNTGSFKGYSLYNKSNKTVYMTLYDGEKALVAYKMSGDIKNSSIEVFDQVPEYKLQPEYLCSVIDEGLICTYTSTNELGEPINNSITVDKYNYSSKLGSVTTIRGAIEKLVPIANVVEIRNSDTLPKDVKKETISDKDSEYPVYLYAEGNIIYYYTEAAKIFLPSNSSKLFMGFTSLVNFDTKKIRTDDIVKGQSIFDGDEKLISLDTSNWNLSKANTLSQIFHNCKSLRRLDTSNWKLKDITNLAGAFQNAVQLEGTIDLGNSSFENLTSMHYLFSACAKLTKIILPKTTNQVTAFEAAFNGCTELKEIVNIDVFDASHIKTMTLAFKLCNNLEKLDLSKWVAPNIENIDWAFQQCLKIKTLDLRGFNLSKVKSLNGLAFADSSLETVLFGNKDFSTLVTMENSFNSNTSLKELDLSNAYMPNLTSMKSICNNCYKLAKVDLSNIKFSSLLSLNSAFVRSILTEFNLSGTEMPVIENMNSMLFGVATLKSLDLSSLNATNVQTLDSAFYGMSSVEVIDMTGIKCNTVTNMTNTFLGAKVLKTIYVSSSWSNENVEKKQTTFYSCNALKGAITYNYKKDSADYAKVDGGYFTLKG